jgi:uncharacterized surface protein with fasciclin (FAS1) repeats
MMMKNSINPLKVLAMLAVVIGLAFTTSCGEDEPSCTETTWYADADADGLGDANTSVSACEQPTGYVNNSDDDDDTQGEPTKTVWELVQSTEGLDSLEKYLGVYPDLVATLGASGTFTLFAPTNDAFKSLLETPGFPKNIESINPDIIKNVLAYHISVTSYLKADLTSGKQVTTLATGQGVDVNSVDKIVVNADGTLLTGSSNNAIAITGANKKATNGVMHVVSSVLIPQTVGAQLTPILGTNAGALLLGADFSILAQAIFKADTFAATNSLTTLVSIFSGTTYNTVFAPTNATFNAGSVTAATYTGQQWYGIIANHIVMDEVLDTELTTGATYNTAFTLDGQTYGKIQVFNNTAAIPAQNGVGIYLDGNGDVDLANPETYGGFDAEVALPNAVVNPDGRIHVIAGVLAPQ